MAVTPIYRPYVFLRCGKCGRKTDHVLVNTAIIRDGAIEENFECQQCGKVKKIYELASIVEPENLTIQELKEKISAKRTFVEQLESKKRDLEERLKEPQMKDSIKGSTTEASSGNQQPEESDPQPKKQRKKKKRRFF
jgi:uncharacterized coiled-coil protein SlyX